MHDKLGPAADKHIDVLAVSANLVGEKNLPLHSNIVVRIAQCDSFK